MDGVVTLHDPNAELFERWRLRGDTDALARVFDATAPRLLALAVHLAGNVVDAEDLVQATFLTAIERSASFDRARPLEPWLAGILSNHARDLRKSSRAGRDIEPEPGWTPTTPFDGAAESESREVVAAAVDKLEEPYRSVLILATRHAMSPAEIAYALQRSPGAVRVQLHRGRELLRKLLPVGMVAGVLATRGLADVRASVLARAEVLHTALRAGSIAGGVLVGKKLVASLALVAVALFVLVRLHGGWLSQAPTDAPPPQVAAAIESPPEAKSKAVASPAEQEPRVELSSVPKDAAPTVRLYGRVLDADSGAGIAGADVSLYTPHRAKLGDVKRRWSERSQIDAYGGIYGRPWPRFGGKASKFDPSDGGNSERALLDGEPVEVYEPPDSGATPVARVRSDADGQFEIAAPESLGFLCCEAEGYAKRQRAISPNELNPTHLGEVAITVAMRAPRRVSGYIVDKDMRRIARHVRLGFFGHLSKSATVSPGPDGRLPKDRDRELDRQCDYWVVETKTDGSFECELPALIVLADCLEADLTVASEWLVPSGGAPRSPLAWFQTGGTDSLALELAPVSSISVRDRESHAPIEYIHLLCKSATDGVDLRRGTYVAKGGRLRLAGEDVGRSWAKPREGDCVECLCTVWADGYLPLTQRLPNLTDGYTVEFELVRGATPGVEGLVREGDRAVTGAFIELFENWVDGWAPRPSYGIAMATSDGSGRFRLEAPAGRYRMQVQIGEKEDWRVVDLPGSTPIVVDLSLDTRLVVEVRDGDAAPCPGLPVLLRGSDGRAVRSTTDAKGLASFSRLAEGTQRIRVSSTTDGHPENSDGELVVELQAGRERRVEITVSSKPRFARLSVEGITQLADWRACVPKGTERPYTNVEADGRIPLDIRNKYLVAIESPDRREWECLLPKDAPDGYSVRIVPDGPGFEGTLCSMSDGKPLADMRVIAMPWDNSRRTGTVGIGRTDAQGHFHVTGLAKGKHYLRFEEIREWKRDYQGIYVIPRDDPSTPLTSLALAVPRHTGLTFENLDMITVKGTARRASNAPLPSRGALACELDKPGYTLRAYVDFALREDGHYEARVPVALRFVASLWRDGDDAVPEMIWSGSGTGDTELHDFELP